MGDIDLRSGTLSISKSYYMGEDGPTKTVASERVIPLGMPVIEALKAIKPLHVTETDLVSKTWRGGVLTKINGGRNTGTGL